MQSRPVYRPILRPTNKGPDYFQAGKFVPFRFNCTRKPDFSQIRLNHVDEIFLAILSNRENSTAVMSSIAPVTASV